MATLVSEVIERARVLLRDADPDGDYSHADIELLGWVQEGHSFVVIVKPNANVANRTIQLQPGTRQELPAGAIGLVQVYNNMGADGSTPGNVITIVDRQTLDNTDPGWHGSAPDGAVIHYVYDEDDPTHFDVYPPQPDPAGYVRAAYPTNPTLPAGLGDTITLDDIYAPVLTDYVVFRALSKDGANPTNEAQAQGFYTRLTEALGVKRNIEIALSPNQGVIK